MREVGRVKWFSDIKGVGLIRREKGCDLTVHYRMIRGTGYRGLSEGDVVEFRLGCGEKGPQAEDVVVLAGGSEGSRGARK